MPYFDAFFEDGDSFTIGNLEVTVELSAGPTLASISYLSGDAGFVHDTLMYPDSGSSRADFPGGNAAELWDSIQSILSRPGDMRLFVGHDYGKGDRKEPMWEATLALTGERRSLTCDAVMPLTRRLPVLGFYDGLCDMGIGLAKAGVQSLIRIGDAEAPHIIAAAVQSGYHAAMDLGEEVDIAKKYGRREHPV